MTNFLFGSSSGLYRRFVAVVPPVDSSGASFVFEGNGNGEALGAPDEEESDEELLLLLLLEDEDELEDELPDEADEGPDLASSLLLSVPSTTNVFSIGIIDPCESSTSLGSS